MPSQPTNRHLPLISTSPNCLAVFDFDGTITFKDSLPHFIRFSVGNFRFFLSSLSSAPILVRYALKRVSNGESKRLLLQHFFKGWTANEFEQVAQRYSRLKLPEIVRSDALLQIERHKEMGHELVVVSASIEDWMRDWCANNQLQLIATQIELTEDRTNTLQFLTENCYGQEKVNRLLNKYDRAKYEVIYAYGDSAGDHQMIEFADQGWLKLFRAKSAN